MKKLASFIAVAAIAVTAAAVTPQELTIYINPGHGGHDSDDRNVVIYPFTQGDPEGFWESNSNLDKGLYLYNMLRDKGFTAHLSRTTNTTEDDLNLTTICYLANATKADFFFSIHSNATGTSTRSNFPLMLYRGYDNDPVRPNAKIMADILGRHLYENKATVWSSNYAIRGDWSFYDWGTAGLGVLRSLTVDGMLSEGSFHDYIPETYRLMSMDYKYLEAWHFRKAIYEYFGLEPDTKGLIVGRINDSRLPRDVSYTCFYEDKMSTIDGALVELFDEAGNKLAEKTTDNLYNGIYAFIDLDPGTYTIKATEASHYEYSATVTVTADEATYHNIQMNRVRNTPPVVESYSPVYNDGDEPLLCNTPIVFNFNWDMDTEATEAAFSITPAVEGKFVWSDANYTMSFQPTTPYEISTEYTVRLNTTAKHAGGMAMENPVEFKFFTTDRNFMELLGNYPKANDKVHYKGAYLELRFDKHPNTSPILNQIKATDSQGNTISFNKRQLSYSRTGDPYGYFRMPVSGNLTIGETYHLEVSSELADRDGITLREGLEYDFTAVDASVDDGGQTVIDALDDATLYSIKDEDSESVISATVAAGGTTKLLGTNSLKITYTFADNLEFPAELDIIRSEHSAETVTSSDVLTVRIYGDLTANEVYAEFSSETNIQYIKLATMDFLGWEYHEIPLANLEGTAPYSLTGFKVVENPSMMSKSGTLYIDNVAKMGDAGVDMIEITEGITIHPNPASEYIIANADALVASMELTAINGMTVLRADGNVLNVSEIPAGTYIVKVTLNSGISAVKKVVVKH